MTVQHMFAAAPTIVTEPLTWETLLARQDYGTLGRTAEGLAEYNAAVVRIREAFRSLPDYIWSTKFGLADAPDAVTGRRMVPQEAIEEVRKKKKKKHCATTIRSFGTAQCERFLFQTIFRIFAHPASVITFYGHHAD